MAFKSRLGCRLLFFLWFLIINKDQESIKHALDLVVKGDSLPSNLSGISEFTRS